MILEEYSRRFVGPAYSSNSRYFAGDRLVNAYFEPDESGNAKSQGMLVGTPGTKLFGALATSPVRALFFQNDRAFAVSGARLYEVFSDGTSSDKGAIANPGGNATARMQANGYQILIQGGTSGYIYDLGANTLTTIAGWISGVGASGITMIDNYFLASEPATRNFYLSELNDGLVWNPLDLYVKEGRGDNILTIFSDHRELWVLGTQSTEVWWNAGGNIGSTFQRIQGAFLEVGCGAAKSPAKADNTILWLSQDERGSRMVWRASGYTAQRVSNFAVEYQMSTYSTVADAIGFTYTDRGHAFYALTFPTANATWVLDIATGQWHQREWWDSVHATSNAIRGRTYCQAFGKHIVGDWQTGDLYELDQNTFTDYDPFAAANAELRTYREGPHLWTGNTRNAFHMFELFGQRGQDIPAVGQGVDPVGLLSVSGDGGYTFGNEITIPLGALGQYKYRARSGPLGVHRDFVPRFMITDPIPRIWTGCNVDMTKGVS